MFHSSCSRYPWGIYGNARSFACSYCLLTPTTFSQIWQGPLKVTKISRWVITPRTCFHLDVYSSVSHTYPIIHHPQDRYGYPEQCNVHYVTPVTLIDATLMSICQQNYHISSVVVPCISEYPNGSELSSHDMFHTFSISHLTMVWIHEISFGVWHFWTFAYRTCQNCTAYVDHELVFWQGMTICHDIFHLSAPRTPEPFAFGKPHAVLGPHLQTCCVQTAP